MTATITPVSQHDGATLTRAVAGERVMMDGGAAPIATLLQSFADRCEFAKDAVAFSRPAWSESLYVASGGTNASFTVGIGAISTVVTYRSGTTTYKTFAYAGGTIGASKIQGGGNLANSTWYYVYCYDNAGSLDFEISTTAPNANLCTKSADSTRIYLGCFRTISTGAPLPLRITRGRALYQRGAITNVTNMIASDGLRARNDAVAVAFGSLSLADRVPPHARVAVVLAECGAASTGTAGTNLLHLYSEGDTTSASATIRAITPAVLGTASYNASYVELTTTTGQAIGYELVLASDTVTGRVDVVGWAE